MPMSFMSLLGGLVTLVGTSTNIIVSQVREETLGKPFAMFDFAPVGPGADRARPRLRQLRLAAAAARPPAAAPGSDEVAAGAAYSTEATVPDDLPDGLHDDRRPQARPRTASSSPPIVARRHGGRVAAGPTRELVPGRRAWCWRATTRRSTAAVRPRCRSSPRATGRRSRRTSPARRCARSRRWCSPTRR